MFNPCPLGLFKHGQSITKAYIMDIIPAADIPAVLGCYYASSNVGFIIGPSVSGHIAEHPDGFFLNAVITTSVFIANMGKS